MKYLKPILFVILAGIFVLQSCQQESYSAPDAQTEVKAEKRIWGWLAAAAILAEVIIRLGEGQWQGTTNGDDNGCKGIGNCGNHTSAPGGGQGTGSTYDPSYVGDYESEAYYVVTESGNILFGMDENSDPETKAKFFYDNQIYLSPTHIIDNPDFLSQLGLTEPFTLQEGYYDVYEEGDAQYIVVQ